MTSAFPAGFRRRRLAGGKPSSVHTPPTSMTRRRQSIASLSQPNQSKKSKCPELYGRVKAETDD
jgi:hypothetical protein|uniref:Uncharacterized protein n=1 Tax=Oryza sativa subsp. japonica TaxID=39947 RepID=Q6Z0Z2_ORYSJ|nr:hypothetical protein [Oryza sativa Japonica Group]BAD10359.1 hypothetical protein [Oryza sativa Japonica Group]